MSCTSASASAKFRIQSQRRGNSARDLRHFECVRQAAAKVIGKSLRGQAGKHLRLPGQASKGARVQNPRGVARKRCAIGVRGLRVDAAHEFAVGPATGGNSRRQWGWRFVLERSHQLWSGYTAKGAAAAR